MRFRLSLPLIQTTAMLLIMWAPWSAESHKPHLTLRNGSEIKTETLIPGPNHVIDALDFAQGINLPAVAVVVPAEFGVRRGRPWMNVEFRFFGFWLVGFLCWCMVGRFLDDVVTWRRSGALPGKHSGDLAFALLAFPSSLLLAGAFLFDAAEPLVLVVWSSVWLAVSFSALLFRVLQVFRQRRRYPVS